MRLDSVLRELRKRCEGRSQASLARELGISAPYLSDILLGKRDPGPTVLAALGLEKIEKVYRRYQPTNGR